MRVEAWDVFRQEPDDPWLAERDAYTLATKMLKLAAIILLFCLLLGCGLIARGTLLYASSNARYYILFN